MTQITNKVLNFLAARPKIQPSVGVRLSIARVVMVRKVLALVLACIWPNLGTLPGQILSITLFFAGFL